MHWSGYILLVVAILAAHFGGSFAGHEALRRRWSYGVMYSVVVAALGIPYMIAVVVCLNNFTFNRAAQLLPVGLFPILIYARMRLKGVMYPGLKRFEEPPRGS